VPQRVSRRARYATKDEERDVLSQRMRITL